MPPQSKQLSDMASIFLEITNGDFSGDSIREIIPFNGSCLGLTKRLFSVRTENGQTMVEVQETLSGEPTAHPLYSIPYNLNTAKPLIYKEHTPPTRQAPSRVMSMQSS
jgi:hypothetical protein